MMHIVPNSNEVPNQNPNLNSRYYGRAETCTFLREELSAESAQERIKALTAVADHSVLLTSGGRGSAYTISYLAEAIKTSEASIAIQLAKIPIIFLDLQNHPTETIEYLKDLKDLYPELDFRRFTFHFDDDLVLRAELQSRFKELNVESAQNPKEKKDLIVKAFMEMTKVQLLYSLLESKSLSNGKQTEFIIGGNRKSQSESRNKDLELALVNHLNEIEFINFYPLFDVSPYELKARQAELNLPAHKLDPKLYPSVGIIYEMDQVPDAKSIEDTKSNRPTECGIHFGHNGINKIRFREVSWDENLDIKNNYPYTNELMISSIFPDYYYI